MQPHLPTLHLFSLCEKKKNLPKCLRKKQIYKRKCNYFCQIFVNKPTPPLSDAAIYLHHIVANHKNKVFFFVPIASVENTIEECFCHIEVLACLRGQCSKSRSTPTQKKTLHMKTHITKNTSTIDVNDVLDVLAQNNFSNEKQISLLQILDYILFAKRYPKNICGILERKIQVLKQAEEEEESIEKDSADAIDMKVSSVVILELLNKIESGKAYNDLTKICRLIAQITGNSYRSIYRANQAKISFTKYHSKQIEKVNKTLKELNTSISIDMNKDC